MTAYDLEHRLDKITGQLHPLGCRPLYDKQPRNTTPTDDTTDARRRAATARWEMLTRPRP